MFTSDRRDKLSNPPNITNMRRRPAERRALFVPAMSGGVDSVNSSFGLVSIKGARNNSRRLSRSDQKETPHGYSSINGKLGTGHIRALVG